MLQSAAIDPEKVAAFSKLMSDLLDNVKRPRKAYLRTLIGAIIVGDKSVKIVGSKEAVKAAILGKPGPSKTFVVWDRNGAPGTIRTCVQWGYLPLSHFVAGASLLSTTIRWLGASIGCCVLELAASIVHGDYGHAIEGLAVIALGETWARSLSG
jgi:hypothetical protein